MVSCTEAPSPLAAGSLHTLKWKKASHSPSSLTLGNPASSPYLQGGGDISGFLPASTSFLFWNPVSRLFLQNLQLPPYWGLPPRPGLRSQGARGGDGGAVLCSCPTRLPANEHIPLQNPAVQPLLLTTVSYSSVYISVLFCFAGRGSPIHSVLRCLEGIY